MLAETVSHQLAQTRDSLAMCSTMPAPAGAADEQPLPPELIALYHALPCGVALFRGGRLVYCNPYLEISLGYEAGSMVRYASTPNITGGGTCLDMLGRLCGAHAPTFEGEFSLPHRHGHQLDFEVRSLPLQPGAPEKGQLWMLLDMSSRKLAQRTFAQSRSAEEADDAYRRQVQERLHWLAHYDTLTDLPNRALLSERSKQAITTAHANNTPLAVMFLDLDRFKHINDSLGHKVGDALLVQVAKRLRAAVRERDTVSRLGGDEFVLLLPGANAAGAKRVAEKLQQASRMPYQVGHHELNMAPSMGIALYPQDGTDIEALTQAADVAMYHAKLEGRNTYRFFTHEMRAQSQRALLLENAMRRAIERQEFELYYQPQIDLHDQRIHSVEALLRWRHPQLGNISPAEFIPVAEDTGQILQIGEWVLRRAIAQMQQWHYQGRKPLKVAVNLSAIQFHQPQLPELVSRILDEAGIPPESLELELTEGVAATDPRAAISTMDDFYTRGIRLSIDDFGTGYSSLSQLKKFEIYKVKIDQSFVRDLESDADDRNLVSAIVRMAQALGLKTTAEGVETPAQLAFLQSLGCDEAQGYLFSPPLPAHDLEVFLDGHAEAMA